MPQKISLGRIEFYVTNVCNLTCTHCNRFNNYKFKGFQRWSDYEQTYNEWGNLVDINHVSILGGEPLLNPDIINWCAGLKKSFNVTDVEILTNGHRLNYVPGLYEAACKTRILFWVTLHHINEKDFIFGEVEKFLKHPITIKQVTETQWALLDANRIKLTIKLENQFSTSAIIRNENNNLTLHQSDPVAAHSECDFVTSKNYHFIKGKFYKCGPAALLPEFDQQFTLDISDADRKLLNEYKPLTLENFAEYHKEFFANLDNPIPQCKFCPSNIIRHDLQYPLVKGA